MFIYRILNKVNGKNYIGQTTKKDPYKRIKNHFQKSPSRQRNPINKAVAKYGRDNFDYEILAEASTQAELDSLEIHFIEKYKSLTPDGYNLVPGGSGGPKLSPEKYKEIGRINSIKFKGRKFSKEHVEALSKVRKGFTSEARRRARQESSARMKFEGRFVRIEAHRTVDGAVFSFDSITDCAKALNLEPSNVSRTARGQQGRTQHKGFTFKLLKEKA